MPSSFRLKSSIRRVSAGLSAAVCLFAFTSQSHADAIGDWQKASGSFRVGYVASAYATAAPQKLGEFGDALSQIVGLRVEMLPFADGLSLVDAQASGRLDYAIHDAMSYAAANRICDCLRLIGAPTDANGAKAIASVLLEKSQTAQNGAKTAAGPVNSMTGDLLPRYTYQAEAFQFEGAQIAQSSAELIQWWDEGSVDAVFAWANINANGEVLGKDDLVTKLQSIRVGKVSWVSDPVRFGPHTVTNKVPAEMADRLTTFLSGLDEAMPVVFDIISPAHDGGFETVIDGDYKTAYQLLDVIGQK